MPALRGNPSKLHLTVTSHPMRIVFAAGVNFMTSHVRSRLRCSESMGMPVSRRKRVPVPSRATFVTCAVSAAGHAL